jgi:hypothetical protein
MEGRAAAEVGAVVAVEAAVAVVALPVTALAAFEFLLGCLNECSRSGLPNRLRLL